MQPAIVLDAVATPEGGRLVLSRRGDAFLIRIDGLDLMSSRAHGSEEALARLAFAALGSRRAPRVLVGGLGMGFTLRAVLDALAGKPAVVMVAEVFPAVVAWNRRWLGKLAGHPLADPRVRVVEGDVADLLAAPQEPFELILLDVDNGPEALTPRPQRGLYTRQGLERLHRTLTPGGVLAVWSGFAHPPFVTRLREAGFAVEVHRVRARGGKGGRHVIFVARR